MMTRETEEINRVPVVFSLSFTPRLVPPSVRRSFVPHSLRPYRSARRVNGVNETNRSGMRRSECREWSPYGRSPHSPLRFVSLHSPHGVNE